MQKTKLQEGLLFMLVLSVCLISLEIILRLTAPMPETCMLYEHDELLSFKNRGNLNTITQTKEYTVHYITNKEGLREPITIRPKKEPDTLRILTVGDSFTYGMGLNKEDTFQERLETRIINELRKKTEVINAGVPGYGTTQALEFLRRDLINYSPDIVVFGFFINDITDNLEYKTLTVDSGCLIKKDMNSIKRLVYLHYRTYVLLKSIKYHLFETRLTKNVLYRGRAVLSKLGLSHRAVLWGGAFDRNESEKIRDGWAIVFKDVEEMANLCGANNCKFVLMYIPARIQVDLGHQNEYIKQNGLLNDDFCFDCPSNRFDEYSKGSGIVYINLLKEFHNLNIDDVTHQVYYSSDPHFNGGGAKVVGDVLFEKFGGFWLNARE